MEIDSSNVIGKYEDRFIRRLGEIAILLHLAKSPEGSHAYEMRSKASEIMFERRKKGKEFLQVQIDQIKDLKALLTQSKSDEQALRKGREVIHAKLREFPILSHNLRIQKMLDTKHEIDTDDIVYLDELEESLEDAIKETKEQAVIWSNISGIYPAIETLEKNGLIILDREDLDGGRLKKIYKITELGEESLFRVLGSLMDISGFVMETEGRHFFSGRGGLFSTRILPFRKLFEKLASDLSPDFKKKMRSSRGKHLERPFVHMMMNQGIASPRLHMLLRHPEMVKEHLESIESEEELKITKSFLKSKLLEQRENINSLLEEL